MAEQKRPISMRDAVDIAFMTIQELYKGSLLDDLLLEEVRRGPRGGQWEVTLGFARPYSTVRPGSISGVLPQAKPRAYKRFRIDAHSGEVLGMYDGRIEEN